MSYTQHIQYMRKNEKLSISSAILQQYILQVMCYRSTLLLFTIKAIKLSCSHNKTYISGILQYRQQINEAW